MLINAGLMNESEDDKIEDFDNVFDFKDEFKLADFTSTIVED